MLYEEIKECRICGNKNLVSILNLGDQALTGIFPKINETVESGPLEMVKCFSKNSENPDEACGLVQLRHNYEMEKLYGDNYGYRSGLNQSMINHLGEVVKKIENRIDLVNGDLVIDIASNDGTLLSSYKNHELDLLGIDPTSKKFNKYYPAYIESAPNFFSKNIVKEIRGDKKAKVITSIAMFYDLPHPLFIMQEIESVMDNEGIWITEQSYMPDMISNTSYDTICHEHSEFYALKQFKWMADRANLKIIDIELNKTNGASLALTFAKKNSHFEEATEKIESILKSERDDGFDGLEIYEIFKKDTEKHRNELLEFVKHSQQENKKNLKYNLQIN